MIVKTELNPSVGRAIPRRWMAIVLFYLPLRPYFPVIIQTDGPALHLTLPPKSVEYPPYEHRLDPRRRGQSLRENPSQPRRRPQAPQPPAHAGGEGPLRPSRRPREAGARRRQGDPPAPRRPR